MSSVDVSKITQVCSQLDKLVIEYFDVLSKIYDCSQNMENTVKDGYFYMAKARYNMGTSAVSRLQYNERELTSALLHVNISLSSSLQLDGATTDFLPQFTICASSDDCDAHEKLPACDSGLGLRRRNVTRDNDSADLSSNQSNPEVDEGDKDHSSLAGGLEKLTVDDSTVKKIPDTDSSTKKTATAKNNDPIRWFGVLTPQVLKQAQASFRHAADIACELASLQARLLDVRRQYRTLLAEKRNLTSSDQQNRPES
jgi:hypothetical protein